MGLGDVEQVVALADLEGVLATLLVDKGYVESVSVVRRVSTRRKTRVWRRKTNSSPGLGGCMWPCSEARVVLNGRRDVCCAANANADGRTDDCSRIRREEGRMLWEVIRTGRTDKETSLGKARVRVRGVVMIVCR